LADVPVMSSSPASSPARRADRPLADRPAFAGLTAALSVRVQDYP
jgi:hypothetical protein